MAAVTALAAPASWQLDPARVGRIGVWCGRVLWVFRHTDPRYVYPEQVASWYGSEDEDLIEVVRLAFETHCAAVWIVPEDGTAPGPNDPAWLNSWPTYARLFMARTIETYETHELTAAKGTALAGLVVQRRGPDGRGRGLPLGIYATWQGAWPILGAVAAIHGAEVRATHVAGGLALAAFALAAQLRFSPSYTGISVFREELAGSLARWGRTHKRERGERDTDPPVDWWRPLSDEARELLMGVLPSPIQWRRPLVPRLDYGKRRTWIPIHVYDRVASYVASAREVPIGDPLPASDFHEHLPGFYLVRASAPAGWQGPGLFKMGDGAGEYPIVVSDYVWAWEPQIRLALARGWDLSFAEGWYWPKAKRHDLFRPWQSRVWAARTAAEAYPGPAGTIAAAIVKAAGVATIGRLIQRRGHMLVTSDQAEREAFRVLSRDTDATGHLTGFVEVLGDLGRTDLISPHWWGTIISGANERLQAAVCTYAARDTVALYVDALYTLRPHVELEGPRSLGKFQRERLQRVPIAGLDQLNSASAQLFVKQLARWARADEADAAEGYSAEEASE